jgi:acyl-coenzyme A synthetase/AMP-(fatty) acid ligase
MTAGAADALDLHGAVGRVAAARPDEVAIQTTWGPKATYRELIEEADRVAAGLLARGIGEDGTVACVLRNGIGYIAMILAVSRIGARYVPLMSNWDAADVATALERTSPDLIVHDGHRPFDPATAPTVPLEELTGTTDTTALDGLPRHHGLFRMLWTSGSTGFPKRMAWRQDKFVKERHRWIADTEITSDDVVFCRHTLDVAHATDLHVFAALLAGARLVLTDPTAPADELLRQLQEFGATAMSALPSHYEELTEAGRRSGGVDLSRMRRPMCGGAYLGPEVVRQADEVLGIRIRQLYGSTEFGLALGNMTDTLQTELTMRAVGGVGTRLEPLAGAGEDIGELVLISDCTSEGYLNEPEANARTFRDPEFWTGDVALRTAEGFRILGRVTEVLATADGPLPAPMLDERLRALDGVAEAVSLPERPGEYGNEVMVALQTAPGHTEDAVRHSAAAHLDRLGLAASLRFVDGIPRTPVGKIDKPTMRKEWGMAGVAR